MIDKKYLSVLSTISISSQNLITVEVWKLLLSFSSNGILYNWLKLPVWDSSMKLDIIRIKKFNKDNLINIRKYIVWVFVEYYKQAVINLGSKYLNKSITLILSNTRKLDRVLSTKLYTSNHSLCAYYN